MTSYDWPTVLNDTQQRLGDRAYQTTEHALLQHFQRDPQRFTAEVDQLEAEIARGQKPNSPMAVLNARLRHQPAQITVDNTPAAATRRAERLIRNLGSAIEDEYVLRGVIEDAGLTDPAAIDRLTEKWRGEQRRTA